VAAVALVLVIRASGAGCANPKSGSNATIWAHGFIG
jgi:hypothetical protein